MKIHPFHDGDTFGTFRNIVSGVTSEIDGLENEYVLNTSQTELENYYLDKVQLEPLVLHSDKYYIDSKGGTRLDVSHHFDRMAFGEERIIVQGTKIDIAIPYEGDGGLWRIQPSTYSLSGFPELDIQEDVVVFTHTFPDDSADSVRLKTEIERNVQSLTDAANNLRQDIENHNRTAPQSIKDALKRKIAKAKASVNAIADLGIPVKRKDKPPTFVVPTQRKRPPIQKPRVSTEKYKPEPTLDISEYEHILEVLRSMALVIERSPASFSSLDEEAIRTHFLLQLNGHYEGSATGETFNASGKTDILIREDNRNIFIAECKFWRGQKSFAGAVDQLLSYLSWRDSKCALLIFNKTRDSSAVRAKMHETMEERDEYRKTIFHNSDGDSRYVFVKTDDPGREIIITTQLFDIPKLE